MRVGEKRSKPAGTGVWVVKTFPARVTASATSSGCPVSLMSRRGGRAVVGVAGGVPALRAAVGGDRLAEVSLLIQHAAADHWHPEIAGGFELIARDVAETAGVNRQGLAEREFHAEVGHPREGRLPVCLLIPGRLAQILMSPVDQVFHPLSEIRSRQEVLNSAWGNRLEHDPWVMGQGPEL